MDLPLGLQEARRYAAALWRPCVLVATAIAARPILLRQVDALDGAATHDEVTPLVAAAAAMVGAFGLVWFARNLWRALLQPRRDRDAAHLLADLTAAARRPGGVLLEITTTQWVTGAGQRAWAVDTATGAVEDHWLSNVALPPGAFVLLRRTANQPPETLTWLPPDAIHAAARYARHEARRQQLLDVKHRKVRARQEEEAARNIVHEAERIARGE